MRGSKRIIGTALMSVTTMFSMALPVSAGTQTETHFFAGGATHARTIEALIHVTGNPNGSNNFDGTVKVKLLKATSSGWKKLATKAAKDDPPDAPGYWYAKFTQTPSSGRCKMVAVYSGSDTYAGSKGVLKGKCGKSNWQWN